MPPIPGPRRGRLAGEDLLFFALLAVHLLPLCVFDFVPTQDGPAHQATTAILRAYEQPGGAFLRQYFIPNPEALPNWFVFLILAKVLAFLPVPVAERVLLGIYVVLLPMAVRWALGAFGERARPLALLAFPFLYSFPLMMGFYNFCFSLAAFFFAFGYWLRHAEAFGPRRIAVFAGLGLWVYFCHPVSLVMLLAAVGSTGLWRTLLEAPPGAPAGRVLARGMRRWLAGPLLALLPPLLLLAGFVARRGDAGGTAFVTGTRIEHLLTLGSLVSLDRRMVFFSAALAALFGLTAALLLRRRRLAAEDGLLFTAAVFVGIYFVTPSSLSSGSYLFERLNLMPFLVLILWFGTFELSAQARRGIAAVAVVAALGLLGLLTLRWAEIETRLEEYVTAAERMVPKSPFLALSFANQGRGEDGGPLSERTRPFLHASGYLAARRPLVDLALYQANTDHFPVLFRPELNPFRLLALEQQGLDAEPPRVDFIGYTRDTRGQVDYVLIAWPEAAPPDHPDVESIHRQLTIGYERIYSSPGGLVNLYRRRSRA